MIFKLVLLSTILSCCSQKDSNVSSNMENKGEFIMMPDKQEASFTLNLKKEKLTIYQNNESIVVPLKQVITYEDKYAAPKGKRLIEGKSKVIHISKNVFNNNDSIEVLMQLAYKLPNNEPKEFVLDFLISENGDVKLLGSSNWGGTGMGSHPVFAVIDNRAYYGIYDSKYDGLSDFPSGRFLRPHQKLNAIPYITNGEFTNGTIVYQDLSWSFCKKEGIPTETYLKVKHETIEKLIGKSYDSLLVKYYTTLGPNDTTGNTCKMVSTYKDPDYNLNSIHSIFGSLGFCDSPKIIPFLMQYIKDDRSIDLPGDDYGNTKINDLVMRAFRRIIDNNPDVLKNYDRQKYASIEHVKEWWKKNKYFYN